MAATLQDLVQRFTFWAAGVALVAVLVLASVAGQGATRALQRLADGRGADVAGRATALVANYVRERHAEAERLAANPAVIRAAVEGAQAVATRGLDRFPPPRPTWSGASPPPVSSAPTPTSPATCGPTPRDRSSPISP
jgi:hypothetical protein